MAEHSMALGFRPSAVRTSGSASLMSLVFAHSPAMRTRRRLIVAFTGVVLYAASAPVFAQSPSISVTTPPGLLAISSATAGNAPTATTDQAARYSVKVTSGQMKIVGQLDTPLPPGVTLTVLLAAPSGAVSVGTVSLSSAPQDLVRSIHVGQFNGLVITFVLSSSAQAGVIPYSTSNIVLTLVNDP